MTASDIVLDLNEVLKNLEVDGVYDQAPPKSLDKNVKSFIVIDVNNIAPAYDTRTGMAHKAVTFVNIFAKDKANGIKNTAMIKTLTEDVKEAMYNSDIICSLSSIGSTPINYENFHGSNLIYSILKK